MNDHSKLSDESDNQELKEMESQEVRSKPTSDKKALSQHFDIQTYVYVGYAYILFVGIAHDAIFYGFLGINIISYSNVLDVLLSPLVLLIEYRKFSIAILVFPILAYYYLKLIRYLASKKKTKFSSHKIVTDSMKNQVFIMTAFMVFSGFIGFGMGNGSKTKEKLEGKSLKTEHELIFRNGDTKKVHLVGSNSGFVFYVEENATAVTISPFQENILALKKLASKDEEKTE